MPLARKSKLLLLLLDFAPVLLECTDVVCLGGLVSDERNPLFIPERQSKRLGCPKCGDAENFNGRRVQGVVTFTCSKCGNKWHGGLPQEPWDSRQPTPPDSSPPLVQYVASPKSETGYTEIRKRPDSRPEFRKGAPVGEGDE